MSDKKPIFLEIALHKKLKIFSAHTGERLNKFVNQAVALHLESEMKRRDLKIKDEFCNEKSS